ATLKHAELLPQDPAALRAIFGPRRKGDVCDLERWRPWHLRREGLQRELTPHEFGRVLVHMNQRRGALGIDAEADDEGKVKGGIDRVRMELVKHYASPSDSERLMSLHSSKSDEDAAD